MVTTISRNRISMELMRQLKHTFKRVSSYMFLLRGRGGAGRGRGKCNKLDPKVGKAILPTHILVLVDSVMKGGE
jgi:hypothetical protein